jgi:hypothetical protein
VRREATTIATVGALSLVACGGGGDNGASSPEPGGAIDTRAGTYRGVGLGDDVATMEREFGPQVPAAEGERIVARSLEEGENDYSPPAIILAPPDTASPGQEEAYRYEHVVFLVRQGRIGAVIVNADGARLDGGAVRIGDELETAGEKYGLPCGTAYEGSEYEEYPACAGKIAARRHIWFGGDPIRNVTLAVVPLENF